MIVTNDKRREVAAKVRETMGALGQVELDGIPLADLIEPEECDGCEPGAWEVVAMEAADRLGVAVSGCLTSDYAGAIVEALDRRLMPEGMEWPRFEDGEPVRIGDEFEDSDGERERVRSILFTKLSATLRYDNGIESETYYNGCRVKRPAHKVFDADGAEVHKGDEVWSTSGAFAGAQTVSRVICDDDECPPYAMFEERREPLSCLCCCLTHQRPDSWEQLEEDAAKQPYVYCVEHGLDDDVIPTNEKFASDLVRRAKALAERSA